MNDRGSTTAAAKPSETGSPRSGISGTIEEILAGPRSELILHLVILVAGLHSLALGVYIYFFTSGFYALFFSADVDNYFFVRQSGLFLFCMGFFYLFPLWDLKKYHRLIVLIVCTKALAYVFLVSNAGFAPAPGMIRLAAWLDGTMAVVLGLCYGRCRARWLH